MSSMAEVLKNVEKLKISNYGAGITKTDLIKQTKSLVAEAFRADPYFMDEVVQKVTGHAVFVWDNLTIPQLSAIRKAAFAVVMISRGS